MVDLHAQAHRRPHADAVTTTSSDAHAALHASPDDAIAAAAALRATGERVTGSRRAVLDALAGHSGHLSADDVAALIEAGPRPVHRATVYRTLERLTEVGIVTSMPVVGGATVYHLAPTSADRRHLHARCRACGAVSALPSSVMSTVADYIDAHAGFRLEPEQTMFIGLCSSCASRLP